MTDEGTIENGDTADTPTEAAAPAEVAPETPSEAPAAIEAPVIEDTTPAPASVAAATKPASGGWFWGTGRRKAAVARVRVKAGNGQFKVNNRDLTEFFSQERDHNDINYVLKTTGTHGGVDVAVNIRGGGYTGQAGAIVLGLGRALRNFDPSLDGVLREHGFLTRDPRKVERKKPGQPGARKRFQFSKR